MEDINLFNIDLYRITIIQHYKQEIYEKKPTPQLVKKYSAHWNVVHLSDEEAVKYLTNLKRLRPIKKLDLHAPGKPSTLVLSLLFGKNQTTTYLIQNIFTPKGFLDKKFSEYNEIEQHLLRNIFQCSLRNAYFFENDCWHNLSEMNLKKINEKLHLDNYQDFLYTKVKKTFLEIKGCSEEKCELCNSTDISNVFLLEKKKIYDESPCSLGIRENLTLKKKDIVNCLEVCAKDTIEKNSCIGFYSGEFELEKGVDSDEKENYYPLFLSSSKNYSFCHVNAFRNGNWTRLINWGFPNVGAFPCCDEFEKEIFISLDKIEPNQELLWHYGADMIDDLYIFKFVLLNKEEMINYFSEGYQNRYNEFLKLFKNFGRTGSQEENLTTCGLFIKLTYVIEVPAAYLFLHAKGLFNIVEVFESDDHAVKQMREEHPFSYDLSLLVKNFFKDFEKTLNYSNLRELVYSFIIDTVEEISVVDLLHILQQMHSLILQNKLETSNFNVVKEKLLLTLQDYRWDQDEDHILSEKNFFRL